MRENKKDALRNPGALKITNQFRASGGMVYELRCEGNKLIVRIFGREGPADPSEWRVEARTSEAAEAVVVTEWGTTKANTLGEVGRAWEAKVESHGLPTFDWTTVAQALTAVRAL